MAQCWFPTASPFVTYSSIPLGQERQKALENMGISIQEAGIGVRSDKYYLVNLNADPSMNELLVCYLKVHINTIYTGSYLGFIEWFINIVLVMDTSAIGNTLFRVVCSGVEPQLCLFLICKTYY